MGTSATVVFRHTVGNALVVHAQERISAPAQALALAVRPDPDLDNVVVDLPDELPPGVWTAVADALRSRRRGIRLLFSGVPDALSSLVGQWLADRLSRTVVAPHGRPLPGTAGTLFVHPATGSGFMRHRPGQQPTHLSRRHPAPSWDRAAADVVATSAAGAAEPIPGGVWIRDGRDAATVGRRWQWLASHLPCQPDAMAVVLGCPGTPPLALDDVARFWRQLGDEGRRWVRFVGYGPVQLPPGEALGQRLADLLESPVVCFAGLPTGTPDRPAMHTVTRAGGQGWQVFAYELGYTPRPDPTAPASPPRILSHRVPPSFGTPVDRLTYRWSTDAVVEVVQSGLWIRPAQPPTPTTAITVRSHLPDPDTRTITVDDSNPTLTPRLQALATHLTAHLSPLTHDHTTTHLTSTLTPHPQPSTAPTPPTRPEPAGGRLDDAPTPPTDPAPAQPWPSLAEPPLADTPMPAVVEGPGEQVAELDPRALLFAEQVRAAGQGGGSIEPVDPVGPVGRGDSGELSDGGVPGTVVFQVPAEAGARVLGDERGLGEARRVVRGRYGAEIDAVVGAVAEALGWRGEGAEPDLGELVDAAAAYLYLCGRGPEVDGGLRAGSAGEELAFARCVAAGVGRLPAYRGAACAVVELSAGELRAVRERRVLVERAFCHALVELPTDLPGSVDVVIWSMTGRRTRPLEPDGDQYVDGRVVFLPGTGFKVLDAQEATPRHRGRLLLREVAADEPAQEYGPFDDLALASLHRYLAQRAGSDRRVRVGAAAVARVTRVPGLIVTGGGESGGHRVPGEPTAVG